MFMKNNPFVKSLQKSLNEDEIASNIHKHLDDCIINGECCNVDNGKVTSCRCIADVDRNMEVRHKLLAAMIEFNNYNTTNMKLYLQGIVLQGYLIKQRKSRREKWKPEFHVKGVSDESNEPYFFCQNGLRLLFCLGYRKWKTILEGIQIPTIKQHGNVGNRNKSFSYTSEVLEYLMEVGHTEGESQATRFVRELTGIGIRNSEKFGMTLPPYRSKRGMYLQYCWNNGWIPVSNGKGDYVSIASYKRRPNDDEYGDMALWPTNSISLPVCTFHTFRKIWKEHFPLMKIRQRSEDICLQCHIFKNAFKYNSSNLKQSHESGYANDPRTDNIENTTSTSDTNIDLIESDTTNINDLNETIVLKAAIHVKQTIAQRKLANDKIAEAKNTNCGALLTTSQTELVQTIIVDYCQNLNLPHLGNEQPGDAYYFSPLSIYTFGICNSVTGHLHAYVYDESEGAKGGNNVASLILDYVQTNLVKVGQPPMKELNIIMDNCAGQNKNRMVIRAAPYMIESGLFENVNLIFLIKGHTKNMCDRMFNLMKQNYSKRNVYTKTETYRVLGLSDNVTIVPAGGKFKDWDSEFDILYRRPKAGSVTKNHLFSFSYEDISDVLMTTKPAFNSTTTSTQKLLKMKKGWDIVDRQNYLASIQPKTIPNPGLSDIKQVHLYTKWRKLVPIEFQDITCPKPNENVISRIKKDTKAKKDLREALLYEHVDFHDDTNNESTKGRKRTPITRSRQRMNPSVRTRNITNETTTNIIQQNVSNEDEDQTIDTVGDNFGFVEPSKKRKINDSPQKSKESSSIISGLEFAEEMGLITQPPLETLKKSSQSGGSISASMDAGDVSTVDYNMSLVDSQPSEPLPPEELPFLDDDCKLPAIVRKTDVDESVGEDSTELDKDVTVYKKNLTQKEDKATPRRKNESKLKLNKPITKSRNVTLRSDTPKRSLRSKGFDI